MKRRYSLFLWLGLWVLTACQPEVILVEVTPDGFQPAVVATTITAVVPPTPLPEMIEVTRLVTAEVTRIIETTMVTETLVEVTQSPLGSAARPIQLLFPPTVNTAVITSRGEAVVQALAAATGQQFEIGILDSEQAVIDLMCAAPTDTIAFLSAVGYVLAHDQCGVQVGLVAVQPTALTWQAGMLVTRQDSGIDTIEDLVDKRGAVPDLNSLPNALAIQAMLADAAVEPQEIVEIPSDSSAMLAVLNGEVDFATATYLPPILPYEEREWVYGEDDPELWRLLGLAPRRSPLGYILVNGEPEFGGYRVRDARSRIFDIAPEVFRETRILSLGVQVPNETIVFGAAFPLGMARQVTRTLSDFVASEACGTSLCSSDFYGWMGMEVVEDAAYDPLRFVIETLNLSADFLLVE